MKEDLLQYIWKIRKLPEENLKTVSGQPISILNPGKHNTNAGPDFLESRITIGATHWAGQVEIHVKSSLWYDHHHDVDPAYENVILHVVYEHDKDVYRKDGSAIPVLELQTYIDKSLINDYDELMQSESWVPCAEKIHLIPSIIKNTWKDRLIIERLERKTLEIQSDLNRFKGDWEKVFLKRLAMHLGTKVNKEAFRILFQVVDRNLLLRHRASLTDLEALLFGQAGFLESEFDDEYPKKLKSQFRFFKHKYQLESMNYSAWKFMRLRPANFPTIRIAQLAQIMLQTEHLLSKCLAIQNPKELVNLFDIKIDNYWRNHYTFDRLSKSTNTKRLGKLTIYNLLINSVAPCMFVYSKEKGEPRYLDRALSLLESIPPEDNYIIRGWKELNYSCEHSLDSQALIQLKNEYCDKRRCMSCQIGHQLIQ